MAQPGPTTSGRVGRFHLVDRIAVGGMAEVYLACERAAHDFERVVVIKRILPHLADKESFVEMFLQEARIAARINHHNVVQIFELGSGEDELPFIAMEYVVGSTVRDLISVARREGVPVPVGVAVNLIMQACAGIHAAHDLKSPTGQPYGLVHRDLSPHNMMVTDTGHVKLLDFGIAKATQGMDHTRTGMLKGKLAYMSPEQCRQEPLDRRSDIFSLAIVLWELLAGQRLFGGRTELGTMQAIVTGAVRDLASVRADVPSPVRDVLTKALSADRNSRFLTADEMRRALSRAAAVAVLEINEDAVGAFVKRLRGEEHARRKEVVAAAIDRTLVAEGTELELPLPEITEDRTRTTVTRLGLVGGAVGALVAFAGAVLLGIAAMGGVGFLLFTQEEPLVLTGPPIDMVFAPVMDPDTLLRDLEPLRTYLERRLKRPMTIRVAPSYDAAAEALLDGSSPFASLPPYAYIKTRSRDARISPLAIKIYDASSGSDGVLLVQESSTAASVVDLVQGTICYSDPSSTTGYMLPRSFLRRAGVDPDIGLETRFSGNHMQVLRDLDAGVCDVGATYDGAYVAADRAGVNVARLRILAITGRTPHDAVCAGPGVAPDLVEEMKNALLSFDPMMETGEERLGTVERVTGFVEAEDAAYDDLRQALATEIAREGVADPP